MAVVDQQTATLVPDDPGDVYDRIRRIAQRLMGQSMGDPKVGLIMSPSDEQFEVDMMLQLADLHDGAARRLRTDAANLQAKLLK